MCLGIHIWRCVDGSSHLSSTRSLVNISAVSSQTAARFVSQYLSSPQFALIMSSRNWIVSMSTVSLCLCHEDRIMSPLPWCPINALTRVDVKIYEKLTQRRLCDEKYTNGVRKLSCSCAFQHHYLFDNPINFFCRVVDRVIDFWVSPNGQILKYLSEIFWQKKYSFLKLYLSLIWIWGQGDKNRT